MADQTIAKYLNELTILSLLRVERVASRTEIARRLSVAPATVTRLVNGLIKRGLIRDAPYREYGAVTGRDPGRPSTGVSLNPEGAYFLGVELAVGSIRFALIDLAVSVVQQSQKAMQEQFLPEPAVDEITNYVRTILAENLASDRLRGVGVAVPGVVSSNGFIENLPIVGWRNVDFAKLLSTRLDTPFFIENDANAAAFASAYLDPTIPNICTLFLKLDVGCGGAVIVDGRLLKGANGTAAEFGHLRLSDKGPLCGCGRRGCLESRIGLFAIAKKFYAVENPTRDQMTAVLPDLHSALERNDAGANMAIAYFLHWLALGLTSLVNLYNPSTIVLGGPASSLLPRRLDELATRVRDAIVPGVPMPRIVLSTLGLHECAIGAAAVAHHHLFDIFRVLPTASRTQRAAFETDTLPAQ
jgi:predicted NBD/HSP70 family sugar kinase